MKFSRVADNFQRIGYKIGRSDNNFMLGGIDCYQQYLIDTVAGSA